MKFILNLILLNLVLYTWHLIESKIIKYENFGEN